MPLFPLLGANHHIILLHMAKCFIWLEEKKERINEFYIGYMINPNMDNKKSFKEQVTKSMKTIFGAITQPYLRTTLAKNNTRVLALLMFHDTRGENPDTSFRVLICVSYTIIKNYVCIDYLAYQ